MRDRYKDLTTGRVIDTIVSGMNGPNRFTAVFKVFLEVGLQFCRNLVDKSFGRRNVNQHSVIRGFQNLPHRIESR